MSCRQVREFLDAYIDSELDVLTTLQFDRHFDECVDCRAIRDQYQELHGHIASRIMYYAAPKALEDKIRAQLRPTVRDRSHSAVGEWLLRARPWAVSAAFTALLIFSIVLLQTTRHTFATEALAGQVVSSHVRSLMANHLVDVSSSDQHTVKPWFTGKLDFAPVVKDLSSEGFPLTGGRLDYLDNRAVAALVYRHRQHTINLFIWPSLSSDSAVRTTVINGYNVIHWTRSHMNYWVVSDLNAGELQEFTRDLQK